MPPKAKLPAPIDRPLSRAYLREFSGWSTAYPPGLSEPTSLRVMENTQVNRDGSLRIRPGLRYLSFATLPSDATSDVPPETIVSGSQRNSSGSAVSIVGVAKGDLILAISNGGVSGVGWTKLLEATGTHNAYGTQSAKGELWAKVATQAEVDSPSVGGGTGVSLLGVTVLRNAEIVDYTVEAATLTSPTVTSVPAPAATGGLERYVLSVIQGGGGQIAHPTAASGVTLLTKDDHAHTGTVMLGKTVGNARLDPAWNIAYESSMAGDGWPWVSFSVTVKSTVPVLGNGLAGGVAYDRPFVGTHEPFYLNDGTKAYLCAVRETDGTVGFRVMVLDGNDTAMYTLTDPFIDFRVDQAAEVLNFTADTTYVKYLQIDNKIFALSDNGEPMRVFYVGAEKKAKALASIEVPEWENADKLRVVTPEASWITNRIPTSVRRNRLPNPSFETNLQGWNEGNVNTRISRPQSPSVTPVSGTRVCRIESRPQRTNLATSPLYDVAATGISGWVPGDGDPTLSPDTIWCKVALAGGALGYGRSRLLPGIEAGEKYQLAFDYDTGGSVAVQAKVSFFRSNGARVGDPTVFSVSATSRWASTGVRAPKGAVSMRVSIGGQNLGITASYVRFKSVVVCKADEPTGFFYGGSGTDYFWTGETNRSASVYHPPADVTLASDKVTVLGGKAVTGSLSVQGSTVRNVTLVLRTFNKDGVQLSEDTSGTVAETTSAWTRVAASNATAPAKAVKGRIRLTIPAVARGEKHWVDAALVETGTATADPYFDGSTTDTDTETYDWMGTPHASVSRLRVYAGASTIPNPVATYTANTLHADGGRAANPYNFGFFYTFNNEVGESAASKITLRHYQRAWAEWIWETPNAAGEPSGTETDDPEACADQVVAYMPQDVFDEAVAAGAISWSLYMFTWSDQDPVPVTALKVATREIPDDAVYGRHAWLRVTPQQSDATDDAPLPTEGNRHNYSDPSKAGQGLVAADRMILVNDPTAAAVIRWSSNRTGEYTNFTAAKGGGYKTLTTGNLFVPAVVKLWQNPQSVDTLTILCLGTDSYSTSYYMAPAAVTAQSDATSVMGFEETTATPGTTSPYGVEVLNNALYHPLDDQLMKSTANNYNITHKSMTDVIANKWADLATKYWMISSNLDNRLYYLVNNLEGDELEDGCKGNEIWVYDTGSEKGNWSRFLIQGCALRKIEYGNQIYMSVIRPDGIYLLDPETSADSYVGDNRYVKDRPIPWRVETNTQGANRAHDAWAHLQQASLTLGNFLGKVRWGIKGYDVHGQAIDRSKVTEDRGLASGDHLPWDQDDHLLVQRDMKEWFFYAESLPDEHSEGQLSGVQYRYTPVSVNVGYEYGSVETFEYGRAVAGTGVTTTNGVPLPYVDTRRP